MGTIRTKYKKEKHEFGMRQIIQTALNSGWADLSDTQRQAEVV
jgi:hypothetical protein